MKKVQRQITIEEYVLDKADIDAVQEYISKIEQNIDQSYNKEFKSLKTEKLRGVIQTMKYLGFDVYADAEQHNFIDL